MSSLQIRQRFAVRILAVIGMFTVRTFGYRQGLAMVTIEILLEKHPCAIDLSLKHFCGPDAKEPVHESEPPSNIRQSYRFTQMVCDEFALRK